MGRQEELGSAIAAMLDEARLVIITGDAGIGKSRLAAELLGRLRDRGWLVASCRCLPLAEKLPLLPAADALGHLLSLEDGRELLAALDRAPPYVRTELTRLVPKLGEASPTASEGPVAGWQRERLFSALGEAFGEVATASAGLALLVEDVHWADEATLDLLTYLHRSASETRLRIVVTLRTDEATGDVPVSRWRAHSLRTAGVHQVQLWPLTEEETAQLVASLVQERPSHRLAVEVHRRGEGNPFFTEQLVGAALARGPAGELAVPRQLPRGLRDVLVTRVAQVGEYARTTLAALAVAQRPIAEPLLAEIAGLDLVSLRGALRELSDAGLLAAAEQEALMRPRHALVAESVLEFLLPGERVSLHERTARALDAMDDPDLAAEVAAHWARAGHPADELRATLRAAEAAERIFAFSEAADLWQRAIGLSDTDAQLGVEAGIDLALLHVRAIDALEAAGRRQDLAALAERAYRLFSDVPDRRTAAAVHVRVAHSRGIDSAAAARPLFAEALRLFEGTPPSAEYAQALFHHANLHRHEGHTNEGVAGLERAVDVAEQADAVAVAALALGPLAYAYFLRGDADRGWSTLRRAVAKISRLERAKMDLEPAASVATFQSGILLTSGRFEEALVIALEGCDRLRRAGRDKSFGATILHANAVEAWLCLGRTTQAAAFITPLTESVPEPDNWVLHSSRAEVDLWAGNVQEAVGRMEAIALLDHGSSLNLDSEHARASTEIALWDRRPQDALTEAEAALRTLQDTDDQMYAGALLVLAARACADLAERARARRDKQGQLNAQAALSRLDELADGMGGVPFTEHLLGARIPADRAGWHAERGRANGDNDPALWQRAAAAWDNLGRPHATAYSRWRQAEACLARDPGGPDVPELLRAATAAAAGAVPLLAAIADLARRARIRIDPETFVTASSPTPLQPSQPLERYGLTARELLVLELVAGGLTNKQVGAELFMSPKTAGVHVSNILRKLGVTNRVEAATLAERAGLTRVDHDIRGRGERSPAPTE